MLVASNANGDSSCRRRDRRLHAVPVTSARQSPVGCPAESFNPVTLAAAALTGLLSMFAADRRLAKQDFRAVRNGALAKSCRRQSRSAAPDASRGTPLSHCCRRLIDCVETLRRAQSSPASTSIHSTTSRMRSGETTSGTAEISLLSSISQFQIRLSSATNTDWNFLQ